MSEALDKIRQLCETFDGFSVSTGTSPVTPRNDSRGFKGNLESCPVQAETVTLFRENASCLTADQEQALFKAGAERISYGRDGITVVVENPDLVRHLAGSDSPALMA